MSSKVLFPRFEYETPVDGELSKRNLVRRAPPRLWLDRSLNGLLREPATDTNAILGGKSVNTKGDWWGVHSRTQEVMSLGQLIATPNDERDFALFRSRHLTHRYLWDEQALGGTAHEIVLEKLDFKPAFSEVMAIMLHRGKERLGQQLVVPAEDGTWHEPKYQPRDPKVQFHLDIMAELIERTAQADQPIRLASAA